MLNVLNFFGKGICLRTLPTTSKPFINRLIIRLATTRSTNGFQSGTNGSGNKPVFVGRSRRQNFLVFNFYSVSKLIRVSEKVSRPYKTGGGLLDPYPCLCKGRKLIAELTKKCRAKMHYIEIYYYVNQNSRVNA